LYEFFIVKRKLFRVGSAVKRFRTCSFLFTGLNHPKMFPDVFRRSAGGEIRERRSIHGSRATTAESAVAEPSDERRKIRDD
jgi:hypothetical protein